MDRDALLAAALGAAVLTGCTSSGDDDPTPTPVPSSPSPEPYDTDITVLRGWWSAELTLMRMCAAGQRKTPALRALAQNHNARLNAVADHLRVRDEPQPRIPAVKQPAVPLAALTSDERHLVTGYLDDLPRVIDPLVVTLGAELAAGARQHATLLGLLR